MDKIKHYLWLCAFILLSGCTTSKHGSFVTSTYIESADKSKSEFLGKVIGESTQTWFLYIVPIGEAPSTNNAINDAKSKIEGTKYLTDISIDDRTYWKFGYSHWVIKVEANAYK